MEYGLIGRTLRHSYSKEIHEELADYEYELCPLSDEEFPRFMEAREFRAINVTIPYKKSVIPYLREMDSMAAAIGAVNTIVNRDGELFGYNTDYPGFLYMLRKNGIDVTGKKVLLIGNGGAAQAVRACVNDEGASEIVTVRRSPDPKCVTYDEVYSKHTDAEIVINTSPVGMFPDNDSSPIDLSGFKKCTAVVDVIYNPLTTKLVVQARELGMTGVTGLEMLVAQAKYAVEIFLDKEIEDGEIDRIYRKMIADFEKK
ncbi:MAG: shikimate dehydrogenase [Eubacterium sp.]|nr:shikimate dehydrogenase [Eubacterium sp.]